MAAAMINSSGRIEKFRHVLNFTAKLERQNHFKLMLKAAV